MIHNYSCDPILYEGNSMNSNDYVQLAVIQNGPLPPKEERTVGYVWGDAIQILAEKKPDLRIINLENSVTTSSEPWPMKGIHYRMHPGNVEVLKAAEIDCCVLANNHTADWGLDGLLETLESLEKGNIKYAGAGRNINEACSPTILPVPGKGRVLLYAGGHTSSGVPYNWKATPEKCGINVVELSSATITQLSERIKTEKKNDDIAIFSIHWGGNWGYEIDPMFRKFAQALINKAKVDLVYGHSSHHVKGLELYNGKLIIFGCGDFLNDYEGICGEEEYRGDLAVMYFVSVDPRDGCLVDLTMVPTQTKKLRVNRADDGGIRWLHKTMHRECVGASVKREGGELVMKWG